MKKIVLAFLFCFFLFPLNNFTQDMKKNSTVSWKKIDDLIEKDLPESALKEIEYKLEKALNADDFQESLKAYLYKMRVVQEKNPDESKNLIRSFEEFSEKFKKEEEKALLHSMRAELYLRYYQSDEYHINARTQLQNFVPENIAEWTKNIFHDKIKEELSLSLQNVTVLQKTEADVFKKLIKKGMDSKEICPTLYDFLSQEAISLLGELSDNSPENPLLEDAYFAPVSEFILFEQDKLYAESIESQCITIYQNWLSFRLSQPNQLALLYTDLQRLEYVKKLSENPDAEELYFQSLLHLQNKFAKDECVVEVYANLIQLYKDKKTDSPEEKIENDSLAYALCLKGIKQFPHYKRITILENTKREFEQKQLKISCNEFVKPKGLLTLQIESANIAHLELKVYRIETTAQEYYMFNRENYGYEKKTHPKRRLVDRFSLSPSNGGNIHSVKSELEIKAGEYGIYELTVAEKGSKNTDNLATAAFTVSDFITLLRNTQRGMTSIYLLDRESGEPVEDVIVQTYVKKTGLQLLKTNKTDKNGETQIKNNYNNFTLIFPSKGEDKYFSSQPYYDYSPERRKKNQHRLALFTDRSIYRPGQTVYFKGILYDENTEEVVTDSYCDIELLDANYRKLSKLSLKSNEFGSFKGEFVLPEGGINGKYRLRSKLSSITFAVEEYKRPTFEIDLPKVSEELFFDKEIKLSGQIKAYAGYAVPDAAIRYTIIRQPHYFCWWWSEPERIVASDRTKSDAEGKFTIAYTPKKTKGRRDFVGDKIYSYRLQIEATDSKGETQKNNLNFSVGEKSLFIITQLPEKHERNTLLKIPVHTENLNGRTIESTIDYVLYRLNDTTTYRENLLDKHSLSVDKKVLEGKFDTKNKTLNLATQMLKTGYYKLQLNTKDAQNREVKNESIFVLYDSQEKTPPVKSYFWLDTIKTECQIGEEAEITIGTSTENTHLLYEILIGNRIIKSEWIKLNKEIKKIKIPFEESYADGVAVLFTFAKDETLFSEEVELRLKKKDKKLTPTLTVFRDKLKPGEEVEWTVTIPEALAKKKKNELMIEMYDASLDAILPHSWRFSPKPYFHIYTPQWQTSGISQTSGNAYFAVKYKSVPYLSFDQFNWFGLNHMWGYFSFEENRVFTGAVQDQNHLMKLSTRSLAAEKASFAEISVDKEEIDSKAEAKHEETVPLRTNFNETAFFYPQLKTDKEGKVSFKFRAPESLTRWNIKMLAHSPDLFFGQAEAEAVTQKNLMVQLNKPRFVRRSDKLTLVANLTNLSEEELNSKVELQLIDPETEKALKLKDHKSKNVTLKPNETKAIEWQITEFSDYELLILRVTAQAGTFSDGEQHYLPILPDKVLLTESLPLTVRGNETRKFRFENLLEQTKNRESKSLTVEFSGNPTWYAVQALPTLSVPRSENSISFFSAYYVNGLATYLANSTPKLASVFDRWKKEPGSRDALLSNLEKNKELKNILLEETPWVMAAKNESEQKRQIALLFDLNQQKNQGELYFKKMLELQTPEGGFAWFANMRPDRYITQLILLEMARYNKMTKQKKQAQPDWILKAISYVDREIENDFERLKKTNKNYSKNISISDIQWFYLHLRSEYKDVPINKSTQEAFKFYTLQAERYWQEATLYGKAITAIIAYRNGNTSLANHILNSLKENAIKSDEMGMYWARNQAGYFWNQRPIVTQTAILEAFAELGKQESDIDEMKIWLLKQKQTQAWDSPIATIDAIYALLSYGSNWLASEGAVEIKLGDKKINTNKKEAGTAYLKKEFDAKEISPQMGNVSVKKKEAGIAWGAVYWQYYQDIDEVEQTEGALSVSKKLFVEKTEDTKRIMVPIEKTTVKKGDKVITRLVIKNDRNLEFVVLKDLRAACFEPTEQLSGIMWREGVVYYKTNKDASTQFFFPYLPKGNYVFEYELWANNAGDFASGIASVQCQYAPEFVGHSIGERIKIK